MATKGLDSGEAGAERPWDNVGMPWFTTKGQICHLFFTFAALCLAGYRAWPDMKASEYFSGGAILFYALIALVVGAVAQLISAVRKAPLPQSGDYQQEVKELRDNDAGMMALAAGYRATIEALKEQLGERERKIAELEKKLGKLKP